MNIHDYKTETVGLDLSDTVTHICICGGSVFRIFASFGEYEISSYSTEGVCVECNSRVKVPTLLDSPEYNSG